MALFIVICFLAGYIFLAVVALGVGFGNTSQTQEFIGFMTIVFILVAIVVVKLLIDHFLRLIYLFFSRF